MPTGKRITRKQTRIFLERIAAGDTVTKAAEAAGAASPNPFSVRASPSSSLYDPMFAQMYAEAREQGIAANADRVDATVEEWIREEGAAPAIRLAWMRRHHPGYRETGKSQLEVVGPGGGPVQVEERRVYSLAEIFAFAQDRGIADDAGLPGGAAGALPAAREVRSADESEG